MILSDTSDATAPVTVSESSRCMSPNIDEHVHVLMSDSMSTGSSANHDPPNTKITLTRNDDG